MDFWKFTGTAIVAVGLLGLIQAAEATAFAKAQKSLKDKNPKKYEEIIALAATDMDAAMKKMRELARSSGVTMPQTSNAANERRFNRSSGGRFGNSGGNERFGRGGNRGNFQQGGRGGFRQGGRGGNRGGMNLLERFNAEDAVALKFPKETAELNKTLLETEKSFQALAEKAKVTLPENIESRIRRLRAADPAGFAEVGKAMKENGWAAFGKLNELARKNNIVLLQMGQRNSRQPGRERAVENEGARLRTIGRPDMGALRKKYPEEMKKYEALKSSDEKAARDFLVDLIRKDKDSSVGKQ